MRDSVLLVTILFLNALSAQSQMVPHNFLSEGSYSSHYNGNGCSFVDFNRDGWDDITFGTANGVICLLNNQEGEFHEIDFGFGNSGDARHPLWVDIDNDGDLDFFVTYCLDPVHLWLNQGDNVFIDISASCGIEQTNLWESHGASWGDMNGDGFLDVYINNLNKEGVYTNYLYVNNGDGTFTDLTNTCNCNNGSQESFQSVWHDFNEDGLQDLAVINDRLQFANALYLNQGDSTFVNIAEEANFDLHIYSMTLTVGDYDQDDDDDFYITNSIQSNVLLENENGAFTNVAPDLGLEINQICWGAQWFDYDNDADDDLFVGTFNNVTAVPNYFYLNNEGSFESIPANIGFNSSDVHASSAGDYNNDGFTDIVLHTFQEHFRILTNSPNENNWLKINLLGTVSNTFGIGAELRLYNSNEFQKRTVFCGEDYMGQDSYTELFGLGTANSIDSLVVQWPSGWIDTFYNLDANQLWALEEGATFQPGLTFSGDACSSGANSLSIDGAENCTFNWNDGSNADILLIDASGLYSVVIENSFGISTTLSAEIEIFESPNPQINVTNVTCPGESNGMIDLMNLSSTATSSIVWNNGSYFGQSISGLSAGEYFFELTDINGCIDQDTLEITEPFPIQPNLIITSPLCFGEFGYAEVNPSGGSGTYNVNWTANEPSAIPEGSFEVEVTDTAGCSIVIPFEISVPSEMSVTLTVVDANDGNNGSASVAIDGGTPPYSVQWSNSDLGEQATELDQGAYVVFVTDDNECTWSESFFIIDTSVNELLHEAKIRADGNGVFTIHCGISAKETVLLDVQGRTIANSTPNQSSFQIDLSSERRGMYFILIRLENNVELKLKVVNH